MLKTLYKMWGKGAGLRFCSGWSERETCFRMEERLGLRFVWKEIGKKRDENAKIYFNGHFSEQRTLG